MPTSCPARMSCGTVVPIWMNGTHPSPSDGVVTREACGNFENHDAGYQQSFPCCEMKSTIAVKNCGSFYVYFLRPPVSCPQAYCAGDKTPCPPHKWSANGLEPCMDAYPAMTKPPTLSGPIISDKNHSFKFDCKIHMANNDPLQRFEVSWTFDGQEDPLIAPKIVTDPTRVVSLDGAMLQGHINSNVGCKVSAFYNGKYIQKSPDLQSNTFFAGLEVNSCKPGPLVVDEENYEGDVCISTTVPILCDHNTTCCLTFNLDVDQGSDISIASQCEWDLCSDDWNNTLGAASVKIPVVANKDMINDGNKHLQLVFDKLKPTGGKYQNVFLNHQPKPLPVQTIDAEVTVCSAWGDPHIRGFDFQSTNLYKTGDFTMCSVPGKDFEVQIRTWPCGHRTCICGVAIREKNDVIRIDECSQRYGGRHTAPLLEFPNGLRQSTVVQRSDNGFTFSVNLASGTVIDVSGNSRSFHVVMKASSIYHGLCRGICGTNDGERNNEFTHLDGHITPTCSDRDGHSYTKCQPNDFLLSWRANQTWSLFEMVPEQVKVTDEVKYCSCSDNDGSPNVNCTIKGEVHTPANSCRGCSTVTPCPDIEIDPLCGLAGWHINTNKRSAGFVDLDIIDSPYVQTNTQDNSNENWPSANGMSEVEAYNQCLGVIKKSPLFNACEKKGNILNSTISDCMADILVSGSTSFLSGTDEFFTRECHTFLSIDPSNYITLPNGSLRLKHEYTDDVCLFGCGENGRCSVGGKCVCNAGWKGSQCHLKEGMGPQLDNIRGGPICDKGKRPCETIFIDASNVDLTADFRVRLQQTDEQGRALGAAFITPAAFMSAHRIAVKLPKSTASTVKFNISATNDGTVFGSSLEVRVFDPRCLHCDAGGCANVTSACQINGVCYINGDKNPNNDQEVCDVTQSTTVWSTVGQHLNYLSFKPVVTGPDADHLYLCSFNSTTGLTGPIRVSWLIEGKVLSSEDVAGDVTSVYKQSSQLPVAGELSCRVEVAGAHSTSDPVTL